MLTRYDLAANSKESLTDGPFFADDDSIRQSRNNGARRVRVTVDPATASSPRLRVYYAPHTDPAGLQELVNIALPGAFLTETTFKWGFGAASGANVDNKEIWNLQIGSLLPVPPPTLPGSLPGGSPNVAYSQSLTIADGVGPFNVSISAGGLPTGITMTVTDRVVTFSSTPTSAGGFNFTVYIVVRHNSVTVGDSTHSRSLRLAQRSLSRCCQSWCRRQRRRLLHSAAALPPRFTLLATRCHLASLYLPRATMCCTALPSLQDSRTDLSEPRTGTSNLDIAIAGGSPSATVRNR